MQKIMPCLWFDTQAEEAARFYVSVFSNSEILGLTHYGDTGPGPRGSVMTVSFELEGQRFMALNGGPAFKFSPAISLVVNCDDQAEIDEMWDKLAAGGALVECGWLTDRFGVSWQIVPAKMQQLVDDADPGRSNRVMEAVMKMKKLDLAALEQAYSAEWSTP